MLTSQLGDFIDKADHVRCAEWINSLSKSEKRGLAKYAIKRFKQEDELDFSSRMPAGDKTYDARRLRTAHIALFGIATASEVLSVGWRARPPYQNRFWFSEYVITTFSLDRKWVDTWLNGLFEIDQIDSRVAFELYKKNLCSAPTHPMYYRGLLHAFVSHHEAIELAKTTPILREHDIWKFFEFEGEIQLSQWFNALICLSREGVVDRDQLLDACMDALDRDFMQKLALGYADLHEALKPTEEERLARVKRYINLLGSQVPGTVKYALKILSELDKLNLLDGAMLVQAIEPALLARTKVLAMSALKLIASVAKKQPEIRQKMAATIATALMHEHKDVQEKAFELLDRFAIRDKDLAEKLGISAHMVAPSLRSRLDEWIATEGLSENSNEDVPEPAGVDYCAPRPIIPLNTLDELIDHLSYLVENEDVSAIEVERLFDAICRIPIERNEEFVKRTAPLLKRVETLEQKLWFPRDVHYLAKTFVTLEDFSSKFTDRKGYYSYKYGSSPQPVHFINDRLAWLISVIRSGKSHPMLSMPTHGRGFIDPSQLLQRYVQLRDAGIDIPLAEKALALLRVDKAMVVDDSLLESIGKDEYVDALVYALGGESAVGDTELLWYVAARMRNQDESYCELEKRFDRPVGSYRPPVYTYDPNAETEYGCNVELLGPKELEFSPPFPLLRHKQEITKPRCCATLTPWHLSPFFAHAAETLTLDTDVQHDATRFFEPMLERDVEICDMATLALAFGLACIEPSRRGIAIEATHLTIHDGRLDICQLAKHMGALLPTGKVIVSRWTKSLKELGGMSQKSAAFVRRLIPMLLVHDPDDSPRDLGGLLELLYELLVDAAEALANSEAVKFCQKNTRGGKQGIYTKKLLVL